MSRIRLSCQTITFGDEQYLRFPQVLKHVASVGYDGVEIGYRRLAPIVRLEVIACLKYLARGGGYIIGPTKSILPETPKENIIALFETILDQPTRPQNITDVFPDHVIDLEKVYNSFH